MNQTSFKQLIESDYFIHHHYSSLHIYYFLRCNEYNPNCERDELIDGILNSGWMNTTQYKTKQDMLKVLEKYSAFCSSLVLYDQSEDAGIITREAVWLAAAAMTYNEFIRTKSHEVVPYQFSQSAIGKVASFFNQNNSYDSCRQMTRTACTAGNGNQPWAYLVDMGGIRCDNRRRLTYYGEFDFTQPELRTDIPVITISGVITSKALSDFIKNEYSPIFKKQLIAPLDDTHTMEEMEEQAQEMDDQSLRAAAIDRGNRVHEQTTTTIVRYFRDPYIARYAKRRANGVCQLCHNKAPFVGRNNEPFLECHHITWLSRGGQDSVDNVVGLCPNCHRRMHELDDEDDILLLRQAVIGRD